MRKSILFQMVNGERVANVMEVTNRDNSKFFDFKFDCGRISFNTLDDLMKFVSRYGFTSVE